MIVLQSPRQSEWCSKTSLIQPCRSETLFNHPQMEVNIFADLPHSIPTAVLMIAMNTSLYNIVYISGWWFQPLWKILVRLNDHPNYWGKSKMFQTTNQIYIHTSIQFSWTYLCRCMLWARHSMCLNLFFRRPQHKGLATKGMDDMGRNWSPQRSPKIDDQQ